MKSCYLIQNEKAAAKKNFVVHAKSSTEKHESLSLDCLYIYIPISNSKETIKKCRLEKLYVDTFKLLINF